MFWPDFPIRPSRSGWIPVMRGFGHLRPSFYIVQLGPLANSAVRFLCCTIALSLGQHGNSNSVPGTRCRFCELRDQRQMCNWRLQRRIRNIIVAASVFPLIQVTASAVLEQTREELTM